MAKQTAVPRYSGSPAIRTAGLITLGAVALAVMLKLSGQLYWPVYILIATICGLLAFGAERLIRNGLRISPKKRETFQGIWLSAVTLLILLFALEAFCRVFVAWSDGFVVTLSERMWLRRHWEPINSWGYRDTEWSQDRLAGRTKVLVVGDSSTAGAGLDHIEDRYQNVLAGFLGERFAVMTAAEIGWDSQQELDALRNYPVTPDVVILAYSINDIDTTAAAHGIRPADSFSLKDSPLFPLISTSHFLNFTYYEILRLPVWGQDARIRAYQHAAYNDPAVWAEHTRTLQAFADWSAQHHARLVVMLIPDINAVTVTAPYARQVGDFFDHAGASTLDLAPSLASIDPRQMAVSALDAHPNPATDRRIALLLCPVVAALPGLPPVSCPQSP